MEQKYNLLSIYIYILVFVFICVSIKIINSKPNRKLICNRTENHCVILEKKFWDTKWKRCKDINLSNITDYNISRKGKKINGKITGTGRYNCNIVLSNNEFIYLTTKVNKADCTAVFENVKNNLEIFPEGGYVRIFPGKINYKKRKNFKKNQK